LEIRAKLLNPQRFLDRFRHKALGDSQTLPSTGFEGGPEGGLQWKLGAFAGFI